MKTKIFYTTNAGLYFCSGKSEILVDGIHDAGSVGFFPMHEKMKKQMNTDQGLFISSGALLFTHLHKDHYDENAVNEYIRMHPETALWGPGLKSRGIKDIDIKNDTIRFRYGDFIVTAYMTKHSGSENVDLPHCSILLYNEESGELFFMAGDAVLEPDLADRIHCASDICQKDIYAFVMSYQLIEKKSRTFIEVLYPSRTFLIHKPRPEDKAFGKVSGIMKFAVRETPHGIKVEEPEPMSWIV